MPTNWTELIDSSTSTSVAQAASDSAAAAALSATQAALSASNAAVYASNAAASAAVLSDAGTVTQAMIDDASAAAALAASSASGAASSASAAASSATSAATSATSAVSSLSGAQAASVTATAQAAAAELSADQAETHGLAAAASAAEAAASAADAAASMAEPGAFGVVAAGGADPRTLSDRFADETNLLDFWLDAYGDWGPAIQAAVDHAASTGRTLRIPAGVYECGQRIVQADASLAIRGDGMKLSVVRFTDAASAGFAFAFRPQSAGQAPDALSISDLTLESDCAGTDDMLSLAWGSFQGTASPGCLVRNLRVTSREDAQAGTFGKGVHLRNCPQAKLDNVWVLGDAARTATHGIHVDACFHVAITNADVSFLKRGLEISSGASDPQCEAVLVDRCLFYEVDEGIKVEKAIHVFVTDSFTNTNGAAAAFGISFKDAAQSHAIGSMFYTGAGAANQRGVVIDGCNTVDVIGNKLIGLPGLGGSTQYGVLVAQYSVDCIVTDNYIGGAAQSVFIDATSARISVTNNRMTTVASDLGSLTHRDGNVISTGGNWLQSNGVSAGTRTVMEARGDDAAVGIDVFPKGSGTSRLYGGGSGKHAEMGAGGLKVEGGGLGWNGGDYAQGSVSSDANWGGFLRGRPGALQDLSLADSAGTVVLGVKDGRLTLILPTGAAGLPAGSVWNDGGTLRIV